MKRTVVLVVLLLVAAGCGQNVSRQPAPSPSRGGDEGSAHAASRGSEPAAAGSGIRFGAPPEWIAEAPTSSFRIAQYRMPEGDGQAEVVVFWFGPGQGGDVDANIARWKSQFTDITSGPDLSRDTVAGMPVTFFDVAGTYQAPPMAGGGLPTSGTRMRAAILEGPRGSWFIRLLGPRTSVDRWSSDFDAFVRSAHLTAP